MRFVHGVKSSQLNLFSDNAVIFNKLSLLMMWWVVDGVRYMAGICFSFVRAIQITRYVLNPELNFPFNIFFFCFFRSFRLTSSISVRNDDVYIKLEIGGPIDLLHFILHLTNQAKRSRHVSNDAFCKLMQIVMFVSFDLLHFILHLTNQQKSRGMYQMMHFVN